MRRLAAGQLYELARLHALCKQDAQALKDLAAAIEAGFRDAEAMAKEPDFDRLRKRPELSALVERARSAPRVE
jgi:hypothetical protein